VVRQGPGVDRCGDVFRHANAAGSARHGGVLVIAGDDHAAKSSTLPHQTEHLFKALLMPVLYPANVQEYLDYGLHGWAMSRYSGCWVAFKALADTVETSASVRVDPLLRSTPSSPANFPCRPTASICAGPIHPWCRKNACCTTNSTPPWPTAAPTS
jgi:TPP-dependent indolepyruvate ferredoxin oxidoreductase alpha subunit